MRVVIIGGGVIGLWCARELSTTGVDVVVLDDSTRPAVSTPASAGWIVPVLSAPLSGPGIVRDSLRQLMQGRAAFSIGPTPSPSLARWLWAFVRNGNEPTFRQGLRATLDLAADCAQQYAELRHEHPELEMRHDGLLMAARTENGLAGAKRLAHNAAAAGYDGKYDTLDPYRLLETEPALAAGLAGGVYARDELHVRPEQLTAALQADALERGAQVHPHTPVTGIVPATARRWNVLTPDAEYHADRVVIAAGHWSKHLLAGLGVQVPLQSAAGFSITATGPEPPAVPLKLVEANVAVTPFRGGVRLAGRFNLGTPPREVSARQIRRVLAAAAPYLHSWRPTHVSAQHVGLRPTTPDSLPIVGDIPGQPGIYAATGHGMLGLTLAPGTAREIRHQITTGTPSETGAAFAADRFAARPHAQTAHPPR